MALSGSRATEGKAGNLTTPRWMRRSSMDQRRACTTRHCVNAMECDHRRMNTTVKQPFIRPWQGRPLNGDVHRAACSEGFTDLQGRLLAGRLRSVPSQGLRRLVMPSSQDVPRASQLPDIEQAVTAIADAIERAQVVAIVSDSDCDGISSASIAWRSLIDVFHVDPKRVHVCTALRQKDGYGVSDGFVERILELNPRPQLMITCDQGSADQARLAKLVEAGIQNIVVTDHHQIPLEGPPKAALACVNPARTDSSFGDPNIAGCAVIWYVMAAVHQRLVRRNVSVEPAASMLELLATAACGTAADCVDLGASFANRWIVQQGLARIRQMREPIWRAFDTLLKGEWTATSLSWRLVPRVNAAGRLGDAMRGVEAMCAVDDQSAMAWVEVLDQLNTERKDILAELVVRATQMAREQQLEGTKGLCLPFFADGHSGVHGIAAARVVEDTGLPTVCLCPSESDPDKLTGSIRSVEGAHVKNLLDQIATSHPEFELRGGGHGGAGGIVVHRRWLGEFADAWDHAVAQALQGVPVAPRYHDGALGGKPSPDLLEQIEGLQPFGKGFPDPLFADTVEVLRVTTLGKDGKHAQLDVRFPDGSRQRMVWFGCCTTAGGLPDVEGVRTIVYQFRHSNYSRGPGYDLQVSEVMS